MSYGVLLTWLKAFPIPETAPFAALKKPDDGAPPELKKPGVPCQPKPNVNGLPAIPITAQHLGPFTIDPSVLNPETPLVFNISKPVNMVGNGDLGQHLFRAGPLRQIGPS